MWEIKLHTLLLSLLKSTFSGQANVYSHVMINVDIFHMIHKLWQSDHFGTTLKNCEKSISLYPWILHCYLCQLCVVNALKIHLVVSEMTNDQWVVLENSWLIFWPFFILLFSFCWWHGGELSYYRTVRKETWLHFICERFPFLYLSLEGRARCVFFFLKNLP